MALAMAMFAQAPTAAVAASSLPKTLLARVQTPSFASPIPQARPLLRTTLHVSRAAAEGASAVAEDASAVAEEASAVAEDASAAEDAAAEVAEVATLDASAEPETLVKEPPALPLPQQRIRVKLRAYFAEYIEEAVKMVVDAAKSTGAGIMGPVPLPTNRRLYCVLRSPHVNKNSMEHFEIRTHKRLIDIKNPNPRTIDALMQLDIRAGVEVEVKL